MKDQLKSIHVALYKEDPVHFYFSPGRANIIGEHTDYSGGYVMPVSLSLGIYAAVSPRQDTAICVFSDDFKSEGIMTVMPKSTYSKKRSFMNYIEGILTLLKKEANIDIKQGFNITLKSTLPKSAGLSSSAALEVLFLTLLNMECDLKLTKESIVTLAKKVENDYIGVSSGIMDQFVIAYGKKDQALLLDTETLKYDLIPVDLTQYRLVLMNTNKARDLVDSAYNERFKAVEQANKYFSKPLGKVSREALMAQAPLMDALTYKRLSHVVSENARTLDAKEALINGDYVALGKLMSASHVSLKEDFEVSCEELDYLVAYHLENGALGARMTGAGFGGTMIALYKKDASLNFDVLSQAYAKKFNLELGIYLARGADGATRLGSDWV